MHDMPELWWSPEDGLIEREDGMLWLLTKGPLLEDGDAPLPADAVKLDRDRGTDYIRVGELISIQDGSDTYRLAMSPQRFMYLEPVDTGTPHAIALAENGWTMKHPVSCRAQLFHCPVHQAALKSEPIQHDLGRYTCTVGYDGFLVIGEETT